MPRRKRRPTNPTAAEHIAATLEALDWIALQDLSKQLCGDCPGKDTGDCEICPIYPTVFELAILSAKAIRAQQAAQQLRQIALDGYDKD